jgi:hypothetical protein
LSDSEVLADFNLPAYAWISDWFWYLILWCDRYCNLTSIDGGIFSILNFIIVSLCRETNSKIDGLLFISSKCNLDLL